MEIVTTVLPVPNYDIYALPLRVIVADVLVSLAGHVSVKIFLGEYWTGATSDFQNARNRVWTLATLGYFGPPIAEPGMLVQKELNDPRIDLFWKQAEEGVERLLVQHAAEVEAITKALLEKGDLNGKECLEIINSVTSQNGKVTAELPPRPDAHITAGDESALQVP